VPGRRGLGPIETTAIAILASIGTKVFDKAIEDAYEVAQQWCRNRFRRKVEEGGGLRTVRDDVERSNPEGMHRPASYHHVTVAPAGRTACLAGQCPNARELSRFAGVT
jgi:hypothetical protein